jgi:hypothetical protein
VSLREDGMQPDLIIGICAIISSSIVGLWKGDASSAIMFCGGALCACLVRFLMTRVNT